MLNELFPKTEQNTENQLLNVFNRVQATNEQSLINARKIGHQDFTNYISHCILQSPFVANPPVRH